MGIRMDGMAIAQAKDNVRLLPVAQDRFDPSQEGKLSFWQQRALDLQITTMAPPTKPYWNTTMVSAWCAVIVMFIALLGSVAGLYVYTKNTSLEEGRRQGAAQERENQLRERIIKAEQDAADAKKLQAYQSGVADTHDKKKKENK